MVQSRVPVRDSEHQTEASHSSLVSGSSNRNKVRRVSENAAAKAVMPSTSERLPKLVAGNTSTNHPEPKRREPTGTTRWRWHRTIHARFFCFPKKLIEAQKEQNESAMFRAR